MLTDKKIRSAKPEDKPYKLYDRDGLYLLVRPAGPRTPDGAKLWRYDYRLNGKRKTLALGSYDLLSLAEAREQVNEARKNIGKGIDESASRQAEAERARNTVQYVGNAWLRVRQKEWTAKTHMRIQKRLEQHVYPSLGDMPIADVGVEHVLPILLALDKAGKHDTRRRVNSYMHNIWRYCSLAYPGDQLDRSLFVKHRPQHRAALTNSRDVGQLLRLIDSYHGGVTVKYALQLSALTLLRPGELRQGLWTDIDWERHEWRIPADRMKMRVEHIVPLSRQALQLLQELHRITGRGEEIFPCQGRRSRFMSENTVNTAIRSLGYTGAEMTAHGFRGMASTILNEHGFHPDAIERQLAHREQNDVRAAYNHAQHLPLRREMMQWLSDYYDGLKAGKVVEIGTAQSA